MINRGFVDKLRKTLRKTMWGSCGEYLWKNVCFIKEVWAGWKNVRFTQVFRKFYLVFYTAFGEIFNLLRPQFCTVSTWYITTTINNIIRKGD